MTSLLSLSSSTLSECKGKREAERSVNWTVEETRVLLRAWSDGAIQKSLAENLRNRHVFKQLSARMSEMGFTRSPQQCRLRVKTLKANYARTKLQRNVDSLKSCTFKYFTEMDAVLGQRSVGGNEGPYVPAPDRMTDLHFRSSVRKQCSLPYSNVASLERRRPSLSSLEAREHQCPWPLDSDIKLEDGEHSADVFDFSNPGISHQQRDMCQEDDQESTTHGGIFGMLPQKLLLDCLCI